MKWINKGHEYDVAYQNIAAKKRFYLFGAGDYGHQFCRMMEDEINIVGFIDNDPAKQGTEINGYHCFAMKDVALGKSVGIIVTMSQFARVESIEQLAHMGLQRNDDFFIIEEFISVYYVYKYNKVYFSSISFLPSTICNLKCRFCLNFNPFAKEFYTREWDDLKKDVDLFFSCVDYIMLFHVSGGEPMLYRHTADLLSYIDTNYGDSIGTLRTVTNGTVVPSEDVLSKLARCRIEITVDDYRSAVPQYNDNFDRLIEKLQQYNINYYINNVPAWIDLAPERTDYSAWNDKQLAAHRASCSQSWQELRGGKLYSCNYAAYATVAGIMGQQDEEEVYDLRGHPSAHNKELVEFRLGYTTKGYTNFCKHCRGFTPDNPPMIAVADQADIGGR